MSTEWQGLEAVQGELTRLGADVSTDEFWRPWMESTMAEVRRFAVSVSPVLTGSYRKAHRVVVAGRDATMSIDPGARNSASGQPVERYAVFVERREKVYGRAAEQMSRLAVEGAKELLSEYQ